MRTLASMNKHHVSSQSNKRGHSRIDGRYLRAHQSSSLDAEIIALKAMVESNHRDVLDSKIDNFVEPCKDTVHPIETASLSEFLSTGKIKEVPPLPIVSPVRRKTSLRCLDRDVASKPRCDAPRQPSRTALSPRRPVQRASAFRVIRRQPVPRIFAESCPTGSSLLDMNDSDDLLLNDNRNTISSSFSKDNLSVFVPDDNCPEDWVEDNPSTSFQESLSNFSNLSLASIPEQSGDMVGYVSPGMRSARSDDFTSIVLDSLDDTLSNDSDGMMYHRRKYTIDDPMDMSGLMPPLDDPLAQLREELSDDDETTLEVVSDCGSEYHDASSLEEDVSYGPSSFR